MDYFQRIQHAIDYIEGNLRQDVSLQDISDRAYCSLTHFYRVFRAMTGCTIKEYVRRRRLSEAAYELAATGKCIIDIALDFRYESQEAFTRAFAKMHGITPGRYRRSGKELPIFEQVNVLQGKTGLVVEPTFVVRNEFAVVGMEFHTTVGENIAGIAIPAFWRDVFLPRAREIRNAHYDYSLGFERETSDGLYHLAGFEVSRATGVHIPAGMVAKIIPPSKYAVFSLEGAITPQTTADFFDYLYGTWLPASGYEAAADYEFGIYRHFPAGKPSMLHYIPVLWTRVRDAALQESAAPHQQKLDRDRFSILAYHKRRNAVDELEVRIVKLEPTRVAYTHAFSEEPESDAWKALRDWAEPKGLLGDPTKHRVFGHNNPSPSPGDASYGYDFMVTVGPDVKAEGEVQIKEFPGGLYAVTANKGIENIGQTWEQLVAWRSSSKYKGASHQWLEEHFPPYESDDMVMDLYAPISE